MINPDYAIAFSVGFSVLVLALYQITKLKKSPKTNLESGSAVITLVSIMLFHSVYFVSLGDQGKIIFGIVLILTLAFSDKTKKSLNPFIFISYLIIGYSLILVVMNPTKMDGVFIIRVGFIYGLVMFLGFKLTKSNVLIMFANFMISVAICRMAPFIGEFFIGPLLVGMLL